MKPYPTIPRHPRGYVSYVLVISTSVLMTLLMLYAYRASIDAQAVQGEVQLHIDYAEKEETILRSIVTITPNRAIRAMMDGEETAPLQWQSIFQEAIIMANAHDSVNEALAAQIGGEGHRVIANVGDSALSDPELIFRPVGDDGGWVASSTRHNGGPGYPPPLDATTGPDRNMDRDFPIISREKRYGPLAQDSLGANVIDHPEYNLMTYPDINFGYSRPGEPLVAKHNWWAFNIDLGNHDQNRTGVARRSREMIFSIYEIPSQLAISASAFMSLGDYQSGQSWQESQITIEGNIFAGRVTVADDTNLSGLASRRQIQLGERSTIGGRAFAGDPFAPGAREAFLATEGEFFPVSMASESGRAAFIPINRGSDFFDRFRHDEETDTVSETSWNEYSIGALQCAMQIDITEGVVTEITDDNGDLINRIVPTKLRFSYLDSIGEPTSVEYDLNVGLPSNAPFKVDQIEHNDRYAVFIFPERIPAFLNEIGANDTSKNHSIVVNVDYRNGMDLEGRDDMDADGLYQEPYPSLAVVLQECADLTAFTKGFSLVSNLRLYIADDFNTEPTTPPAGYVPAGLFFPPASLFVPEKRYGLTHEPTQVQLGGQIGSLASEDIGNPIRPLDSMTASGTRLEGDRLEVNLRPIRHPAELPPIYMMNWLVLLQERRGEFVTSP